MSLYFSVAPLLRLSHLQLGCFIMLPHRVAQRDEALAGFHRFGMLRSKRLGTRSQGALVPASGFLVVALRLV